MDAVFMGEHRRTFTIPSVDGPVEILGSWPIREMAYKKEWRKPTQAQVKFIADSVWGQSILYPGNFPGTQNLDQRRAAYIAFTEQDNTRVVLIITDVSFKPLGDGTDEVTVLASDPRYFLAVKPSSMTPDAVDEWVAVRTWLLDQLTRRVSNLSPGVAGMSNVVAALPIKRMDMARNPSVAEEAIGIVRPNDVPSIGDTEYTLQAPDPKPIQDSWADLEASFDNLEIYPLPIHGADGTASPYWEWVLRERVDETATVLSAESGTLAINSINTSTITEYMATAQAGDASAFGLTGGAGTGNPNLFGVWGRVAVESVDIPDDTLNVPQALQQRAITLTKDNPRLTIDATANLLKAGLSPTAGMTVRVRIYDAYFPLNIDNCAWGYSFETGWTGGSEQILAKSDYAEGASPVLNSILLHVNGPDWNIPVNNSTASYAWDVYLDGTLLGSYSGTGATAATGIFVSMSSGQHVVEIVPTDGLFSVGWSRAFGFNSGTLGANANANKAKLIRVISDPDFGHMTSTTATGAGFRSNQFNNCVNLLQGPVERLPVTTTTLGTSFRNRQYYQAVKLEVAPAEQPLPIGVTAIPASWRQGQFEGATSLRAAPREQIGSAVVSVGDSFRSDMFKGATGLQSAGNGDEAWNGLILTCGSNFRSSQFELATSLTHSLREAWNTSIVVIDAWHRERQYFGDINIRSAASATEANLGNISSIGNYYRRSQWEGTGLRTTQLERFPAAITGALAIANEFRARQYASCLSLTSASAEVFGVTSGNTTIGASFRSESFIDTPALTVTPVEALSNKVTTIGSSFRYASFRNSGITTLGSPRAVVSSVCTTVGQWYRYSMFRNTKLTVAQIEERPVTAASTAVVTNYYDSTYYDCLLMRRASEEHALWNIAAIPNSWRNQTYRNTNLADSIGQRVVPSAEKAMTKGTQYRENCWNNTVPSDGSPILYTDGTAIATSTNGMPANIY